MAKGNKNGGYTILEVMIFLAVSGLLFLIASLAINGKQAQSDFFIGVSDFRAKMEDVINDASTGFYPNVGSYACSYAGNGPNDSIQFQGGSGTTQATHRDCVFLGKVMYFDVHASSGTNKFSVITVAGRRLNTKGTDVTTLNQAKPVAVDPGSTSHAPDMTIDLNVDRGLVVTAVYVNKVSESAFGMFTSLPQASASLVSGALTTDLIEVPASDHNDTELQTQAKIKNITSPTDPIVVICLRQGTANNVGARRAAIVMGSHDRQITTEEHIGDIDTGPITNLMGGNQCPD